jgi:hypothetical protein
MRAVSDDAPLLDDLMPWSTAPPRFGRSWVLAPDAKSLRARWDALLRGERETLFCPSRSRTVHSIVAPLPGRPAPSGTLADERGPCPDPVRVLHGPYDQQWLIPDNRLLDAARTELWRVADHRQVFVVEQDSGSAVVCTALLPDGPGRIRPLYRRPGGLEPNVAPGLLDHLGKRLERDVRAEDLLAWITAFCVGRVVPLPASGELWDAGVELGGQMLDVQTRGARTGTRPRLPGGRRPYVRAPLPDRPDALRYDDQEQALFVGEGRISPVPRGAWDFHAGGVRVLEAWFDARKGAEQAGTLAAVGPAAWPQEWTSDLLELITVLALLSELRVRRTALTAALDVGARTGAAELRAAGVLPVPPSARRPASVLDHPEEGPGGQFALL